jgi:hypothetical protein
MTHINSKYVKGKVMLRSRELHEVGQYCIELHNYYINNYKTSNNIVVKYKHHHFLLTDNIFIISFSDLYDLFCDRTTSEIMGLSPNIRGFSIKREYTNTQIQHI